MVHKKEKEDVSKKYLDLLKKVEGIKEEVKKEIGHRELTKEEKKMREEIDNCTTMVISVITRGAYLIQLGQIRPMLVECEEGITKVFDSIIIDEIEEMIDDMRLLTRCEIFDRINLDDLDRLLDDLGGLDVSKVVVYGEDAWKLFSKVITDYFVETWEY